MQQRTAINVAVIDLGLPDVSGLEILSRIKTNSPSIEAIILTGNASLNSAVVATNRGAFSYLVKPYDADQLMLQIKLALEKQKAHETIAQHIIGVERMNVQLSEANAELIKEIAERKRVEEERERLIVELKEALNKIKTLSGLLPICMDCKKIRNDKGYWEQIEVYIRDRSEADFSHSICPECMKKRYP
jgi:DNA-binding NtrC family response regulator